MKKIFTLILALVAVASSAMALEYEPESGLTYQAQFGMNISNFRGTAIGTDPKPGFNLGVRAEYMLPGCAGVYLNAGALYGMKGAQIDAIGATLKARACYAEIPIHVGFRYNLADNLGIYGEVGPYFSMGINGKNSTTVSADGTWVKEFEVSYNLFSSHDDKPYFQIWDFGFGFRIGAEYENHYSLSVGMDWGITDMFRDKYRDKMADNDIPLDMAHNYNTYITLGYRF